MRIPSTNPNYVCPDIEGMNRLSRLGITANVLLTGPTGSGKTTYAEQFAAKFNRPAYKVECGCISEAEQLIGQWEVVATPSGGSATVFRVSPLLEAIQTDNAVIILNELNRLQSVKSENALMSLLDYQRSLEVQEINRTIHVGKNVLFFCTINEGSQYTATDLMDYALNSRMTRKVAIDWLPEQTEFKVLKSLANDFATGNEYAEMLQDDALKNIIRLSNSLRGTAPISLRQMEACAQELMLGATPEQAVALTFSSLVDPDEISGIAAVSWPGFHTKASAKK
jgi:MoxR-like ATPase